MTDTNSYFSFLFMISLLMACSSGTIKTTSADSTGSAAEVDTQNQLDTSAPQIAEYVVDVFQDSRGHMWMGTMARGVARWDGEQVVYFTPADGICGETISGVQEDAEGDIWFNSHTGICSYDGETFTTHHLTSGRHDDETGWMSVTFDEKGGRWIRSNAELVHQVGDRETVFDLPTRHKTITSYAIAPGRGAYEMTDSQGNLWFSTDGDGAYRYDGAEFTHFNKANGLCSDVVNEITEDGQGRIWFVCMQSYQPRMTEDGGACYYDPTISDRPEARSIERFDEIEGLSGRDLYSLMTDSKGQVWIGATGLGVYRHDGTDFHLYEGTDRMDLTNYMGVQDILEDDKGQMWFGMSGGLFRLIDDRLVNVTQAGPWE